MGALVQTLKSTAVVLLCFGTAYAVFFYCAHFTEVQSVVLAVVGSCAIDAYRLALKIAEKQRPEFEPFWIKVRPNWHSICHDFGLAADEKWGEIRRKCSSAPTTYSVFQNGFNFTMLSKTLSYSNDHQYFFGELDFHVPVEELRHDPDEFSAPQFYIKRTLAGAKNKIPVIEIGFIPGAKDPLSKAFHPTGAGADSPVARLPEIVFYGYFHADSYDIDKMKKIEKQTKALLAEFGWTEKERDPEDSWLRWPFEINHKYFEVTYRGLS